MQSQIQQHLLSINTKCHALAWTCPHKLVILMANQIWKPTWPCLRALSLQSYASLSPAIRQTTWKRPCISTWKRKFFDITNSSIISQNPHPKKCLFCYFFKSFKQALFLSYKRTQLLTNMKTVIISPLPST